MRWITRFHIALWLLPAAAALAIAAQPVVSADGFVQAPRKAMGAGVGITYRVLDSPALGRPTRVEVVVSRITDPAGAVARFTADPALRLETGAGPYSFAAGQDGILQLSLVPQAEGLAYLNLFVTQHGATSSTSIPIQVGVPDEGAGAKPAMGYLKDAPDGGKILALPVK